jgi:chromosome segregation ATPase
MSEAEQAIDVSEWKELHAELEEVREKRNRLQTENNRLKALIQLAQKEWDEAKNELRDMTAERDAVKEASGSQFRMVQALQRDVSQLQVELSQWQVGHDAASEQLAQAKEAADMFEQENASLQDAVRQLRAKQIHADLPGILMVIHAAAQQARELI